MKKIKLLLITMFLKVFFFRKNKKYIVCPDHIGETVYTLLYYKKFKENNPNQKIIIVCLNYLGSMCSVFHVDQVVPSTSLMRLMRYYCQFSNVFDNQFVFYAGYRDGDEWWRWNTDSVFLGYTKNVLHLNTDSLSCPTASYENLLHIEPNSILVAPYAKTVDNLPLSLWQQTADMLISFGFTVYTNIAGTEQPLTNTKPFHATLSELFDSVHQFKMFMGLRSGLCDLVSLTGVPMIVITNDFWSKWRFDAFAKSKISTVIFKNNQDNTLLNEVIDTVQNRMREQL